jgi:hypothetical protein
MKYFLVGVANADFYNNNDDLMFTSRAATDTTLDVKIANSKITGGWKNKLQYVYFHTPEMDLNLTDSQLNLGAIASTLGSSINIGDQIYKEEIITLGVGGAGVVSETPLSASGGVTIYGWVTDDNDVSTKVTFTGSDFTLAGGTSGQVVTVRYYVQNDSVESIDIPSDFTPKIGKLVLTAQLGASSNDDGSDSSIIGEVQVTVYKCILDGSLNLSLKSNGVSNTPIKALALTSKQKGKELYATMKVIKDNGNWYDNVTKLALGDSEIDLSTGTPSQQLDVYAIPNMGDAFLVPDYSNLTFTSSDVTKATVNASGNVTKIATGSCTITISITSKPAVSAVADVTIA